MAFIYENQNGELIGYELESEEELQELIILMLKDKINHVSS